MKMDEQSYVFLIFRVGFSIFKEAYTNFSVRAGCLAGARRVARKKSYSGVCVGPCDVPMDPQPQPRTSPSSRVINKQPQTSTVSGSLKR